MQTNKVFKPHKSNGWLWPFGLGIIMLGLGVVAYLYGGTSAQDRNLTTPILCLVLSIPFFLAAAWFPTMRYEIEDRTLHVRYGPWLHYVVPAASIRSMEHKVLPVTLSSSFRFKGLSLFNIRYPKVGVVQMCSTSESGDILLIETDKAIYGISPEDEKGLISALKAAKRG